MEFSSINNFNFQINTNPKAGLVQNSQNPPQAQAQVQAQNPSILAGSETINPALIYDFQATQMDSETILKYLQNLLKLPNSIDKFVNQLNSKNVNSKLASILVENMISVKLLSEFLNVNSKEAISKLMQVISSSLKSGNSDISQLKEILSILGTIQNSTSISTNSIKELLLLYIPLNVPVFDKKVDNKIENQEENEAIKNAKMSILFETINFSNILITLNEEQNSAFLNVFALDYFPKNEFQRIIEALSKETGFFSLIDFKNKKIEKNNNSNYNTQNFKILSDGFISPNMLILAHIVIKTIFKIDTDYQV